MTEPELRPEPRTAGSESRADEPLSGRWQRRGRPFRFAAVIIALAGIVFIVAVIFWSGFVLGACSGGHHRHNGRGDRDQSMSSLYAPESSSEVIVTGVAG